MKKTLTIFAAALVVSSAALVALPVFAATNANTPFCNSTTTTDSATRSVVDELHRAGASVLSTENWNGCLRAVYSIDGHSGMVFFDPDTLRVVGGTMPSEG